MFKKVLYPINLSFSDDYIFESLKILKKIGAEEIILMHVVALMYAGISQEFQENDKKELENKKMEIEKLGFKVSIRVPVGIPFSEIIETTKNENISLIVLAIHELGIIEEALMGNVAERVIRSSSKPVLLYRIKKHDTTKNNISVIKNTFNRILFPTDWSECANAAIPYLKKLNCVNSDLLILHVMDKRIIRISTPAQIKKFKQNDLNRLAELKNKLIKSELNIRTKLSKGIPFYVINKVAEADKASLIIMGSHGKGFIKEMQQGSTSEKVIRFGSTPILLINHPK